MGTPTGYGQTFCYDQSGRLIREGKSSEYYGEEGSSDSIVYLYDQNSIIGMLYTVDGATSTYYFQRNLLGDVIGIYNTSGTKVGGYAYDAWGNCTITLNTNGIATRNPIRYRGYYYDADTNLYYLNARYYSPELRRFISPDDTAYLDPETPNGLNLYCYCNNDPVNYADPNGHFLITLGVIAFFTVAAAASVALPVIATAMFVFAVKGLIERIVDATSKPKTPVKFDPKPPKNQNFSIDSDFVSDMVDATIEGLSGGLISAGGGESLFDPVLEDFFE